MHITRRRLRRLISEEIKHLYEHRFPDSGQRVWHPHHGDDAPYAGGETSLDFVRRMGDDILNELRKSEPNRDLIKQRFMWASNAIKKASSRKHPFPCSLDRPTCPDIRADIQDRSVRYKTCADPGQYSRY